MQWLISLWRSLRPAPSSARSSSAQSEPELLAHLLPESSVIDSSQLAHFIREGRVLLEIAEAADLSGQSEAQADRVRSHARALRRSFYGFVSSVSPYVVSHEA